MSEENSNETKGSNNTPERGLLAKDVKEHFWRYASLLVVIGLVNNLGYVMVGTTAKKLSRLFHKEQMLGLFQFFLIIFNGTFRLLNSRFFIKIIHIKRLIVNVCAMVLGYVLISISCFIADVGVFSFFLSLFASCIHGLTSCFGESVILGYLKGFPADLVVGWSSGTGFAGVVGAGLVVLLSALEFQLSAIYLCALGLVALYLLSFIYLNRKKNRLTSMEMGSLVDEAGESSQQVVDEAKKNVKLGFGTFCQVFKKIWILCGSLSFVYYFEYSIFTSFTDRTIKRLKYDSHPGFLYKNLFEILLLSYQCGVVVSRSSLKLIKVPEVWFFFIVQGMFYFFWLAEVILVNHGITMVKEPFLMIFLIFLVGICGGGCYVNVMYCIISHKKLEFYEKELALNICTILDDVGVISASITALIMSNFIYP